MHFKCNIRLPERRCVSILLVTNFAARVFFLPELLHTVTLTWFLLPFVTLMLHFVIEIVSLRYLVVKDLQCLYPLF